MKIKVLAGCLLTMLLLCACGKTQNTAVNPTTNTSVTVSQTEEVEAAETISIAQLYKETDTDRIFQLNAVNVDGYCVEDSFLCDGYVLLLMRDYLEEGYQGEIGIQYVANSGKLVLFPLLHPDAAVTMEVSQFHATYLLLPGGTVLESFWDGGYTVYNASLEEEFRISENGVTFMGASEQGDIWFLTEDSSFVLYRDGKQQQTIPTEGTLHGSYIGSNGSKAYFTLFNQYYGWTCGVIDMQSWTYEDIPLLSDSYDTHNGLICYLSNDKWYIADIADPFLVTAFPKLDSDERVWNMDDRYLIGSVFEYDAAQATFYEEYHIYDLHSGGFCSQINSNFSEYALSMRDYDQGVILFETHDEKRATKSLYLWDISELTAPEPVKAYDMINYHVDAQRVQELTQQIYEQYGVTVYYDEEHLAQYSTGYQLLAASEPEPIGYTLIKLTECMAEYPEGFFEEIKGQSIRNVVFCLCAMHDRVDMDIIEDAAATVNTVGDTLLMSIDVHYWQDLRRIFLHENTHMMENRLFEEMPKVSNRSHVEYWYTDLNLPGCPPIQSYTWERTPENLKGVYDEDPENACYIDWYSKCTISEDHARILENGIYSDSAHYFTAPYIDRKSRFLNAMIREAFPCVQNSGEVFWEQRTGIVDLRQEFADFVNG